MELLTPRGHGGVAVVRAVGEERVRLLALLRPIGSGPGPALGGPGPVRATLHLSPTTADDVLVMDRGAQGLEVHLHGSPVLLEVLARTVGPVSEPELDPVRALLARAFSRAQVELAAEQAAHDFDAFCARLANATGAEANAQLRAALERSRAAIAHATPLRIAICGRQNAGKSTFFNRLLFRERALTGPLPGLTRDAVAEATELAGYPVELVDTAGEGPTTTRSDEEALRRARAERDRADVLLLAVDRSAGPAPVDRALLGPRTLVVATKGDRPAAIWPTDFPSDVEVACLEPRSAAATRARVGEVLRRFRGLPPAGPVGGPAALAPGQWMRLCELASARGIAPA